MQEAKNIISLIQDKQDLGGFQELNWKGNFEDYLDIVIEDPRVARTAFQRVYDMVLSHGVEEFTEHKNKVVHYKFFDDVESGGVDAIYGLENSLMKMVNIFKSAAQRYGTEKRILLLHGPVGSAKSTIVRLLKKGIERYSRTADGRLYTFGWLDEASGGERYIDCPMHEDPLHLIPEDFRADVAAKINANVDDADRQVRIEGELCPSCRYQYAELLKRYNGDWTQVMNHIQVRRLVLSEKDRVGIGTFQPKDEKNQDSTELTGDHQLPQDRRVRQRLGPAGVQLRR